jgi:hypothetical protein
MVENVLLHLSNFGLCLLFVDDNNVAQSKYNTLSAVLYI